MNIQTLKVQEYVTRNPFGWLEMAIGNNKKAILLNLRGLGITPNTNEGS